MRVYDIGATGGIGSLTEQGWNLFGSVGYRWQKSLPLTARSFASTGYIPVRGLELLSSVTFPSTYYQGDFSYQPQPAGLSAAFVAAARHRADANCDFDYSAYTDLVPKQDQLSALVKGSYAVDKDNTLSLEFLQGNNKRDHTASRRRQSSPMHADNEPVLSGRAGSGRCAGHAGQHQPELRSARADRLC